MFKYLEWSFTNYDNKIRPLLPLTWGERITSWLVNTALFEDAWARVCKGLLNWWWSEQLCLFTVGPWTMFLAMEGSRKRIKFLPAYMLLGQLVAISVASNLFYAAILLAGDADDDQFNAHFNPSEGKLAPTMDANTNTNSQVEITYYATPTLWIPVFVGILTVILSPWTGSTTFLPNLLVMHSLLFIPLLTSHSVITSIRENRSQKGYYLNINLLYFFAMTSSLLIRILTTSKISTLPLSALNLPISSITGSGTSDRRSLMDLVNALIATLYEHPAQSSIGWDVIWTSVSLVIWVVLRGEGRRKSKWFEIPYAMMATPLSSLGVTASYLYRVPESRVRKGKAD